jgi:hypothetical protein
VQYPASEVNDLGLPMKDAIAVGMNIGAKKTNNPKATHPKTCAKALTHTQLLDIFCLSSETMFGEARATSTPVIEYSF